jgi:seryl-tRNA synthetase
MLDLKLIRQNPDQIKIALAKRSSDLIASVDQILDFDKQKRSLQTTADELKAKRNSLSKSVKSPEEAQNIKIEVKKINEEITIIDLQLAKLDEQIAQIALYTPNAPLGDVPEGLNESQNRVVHTWGQAPQLTNPQTHYDLAEKIGLIDFENTSRFAGARLSTFIGWGARLERALIQFMLDTAAENGYTEFAPPALVREQTLQGTGQLPKFAADLYHLEGTEQYLIPTAEVPLTSFFAGDKPLPGIGLPKRICAYTPCFRSEAGAAGRDTRGLIRQHQFDKVELVHLCKPIDSETEHERLVRHAETLLEKLGLHYRRLLLCTGDMGFSAAKCYDLEVWFPAQNAFREISSCSNCTDFQARRLNLRFKPNTQSKAEFVHTLNGSGLAVGRTWAAIVENYQLEDGSGFKVPEVLQKYLGTKIIRYPDSVRILIIDDALFMRTVLKDIFQNAGYELAAEALNGQEGIDKFISLRPDLTIIDIAMPDIDGLEVLKQIKKIDPNAKVIMCSALNSTEMIEEALKEGAADFVIKPFQAQRVKEAIEKVLQ